jgi:predicted nucleotidyltransferase component of viral defense system
MILKPEIIQHASDKSLNPAVIEKDYVLGWVLHAISRHAALADKWVFKGGTCLKKCFFETYRFSEDLDFTLLDESHINEDFLKRVFGEISETLYEQTGIELPVADQKFDIYNNKRGTISCQGKLPYRGPIAPRSLPRIKLDLTADERIVLPPVRAAVYHPYTDEPEGGFSVLSYAYEEAFGEKVRALGERTRPRDLYDVVNLYRNAGARPAAAVLLDVIQQKCAFKKINVPVMADIAPHRTDLEGSWANMLAHQLPALPSLNGFWEALPEFFDWLEGRAAPAALTAFPGRDDETVVRQRGLPHGVAARARGALEVIRYAASNRICVNLDYRDAEGRQSRRLIEPYSLRRSAAGDLLLAAIRHEDGQSRSYRIDRIIAAEVSTEQFIPRYDVELTPEAPVQARDLSRASVEGSSAPRAGHAQTRRPRRRARAAQSGPRHIYECSLCSKRFTRKSYSSALNPHNSKDGYPCSGRSGIYIETRY